MSIPAEEVVAVLCQAARKEIPVELDDTATWDDVFCGPVQFKFGDWTLTIYNDCSEFDYVEEANAPDGRTAEFESWDVNPVDALSQDEIAELECLVGSAQ